MSIRLLIFAAISASIAISSPVQPSELGFPERPVRGDMDGMKQYRKALYLRHQTCASQATQRLMSRAEVDSCAFAFMLLKLSFLDGVSHTRYKAMSAKTRAVANEKGYAAYRAWLHGKVANIQ